MPNFVEVWYGSSSSQDKHKWRIHLPFDLAWVIFLLMLRIRLGLLCANTVSVLVNRIGLFLINLSMSLLNVFYQASLFFWPLSEWGVLSKFFPVPWIPETPSILVISQLLFLSRDLPLPCLSLLIQFLPVALMKIEEIHLCIRNIFNHSKEQLS